MAPVHYEFILARLFRLLPNWIRLRGIFAQIDLTEVSCEIRRHRNGKGQTGLADRSDAASGIGHDRAAAPKRRFLSPRTDAQSHFDDCFGL